ncbi:hypothetical protein FRC12_004591 [Ceratobasidium sp. 428]|nr:hypothetical protein FRC12_004591 [Ceratobasidium sp. 428]
MRLIKVPPIIFTFLVHARWVSSAQQVSQPHTPKDSSLVPYVRYTEVQLPPIHLDNFYVDTGHNLQTNLAPQLLPWTHSSSFHKNGTVRPIILASFDPFSAVDWLTFNSTTFDLSGQTPFSQYSFNVSVTLIPMFVNKTEDIAIPQVNSSTPITFTTATFSIHVLSEGTSDADLKGWTPYLLVIISVIAVISVIEVLATCFWQDLCCCSWRVRSSRAHEGEKIEETKQPEDDTGANFIRSLSTTRRILESSRIFSGDTVQHSSTNQVTPYRIVPSSSTVSRRSTLVVKQQQFVHNQDSEVIQTIPSDTEGIQRINTKIGTLFAVGINLVGGSPDTVCKDVETGYRVQVVPYPPPWMQFCPDRLILWGTPSENLSQGMTVKFNVSVISNSSGLTVGKLGLNVFAASPPEEVEQFFSDVFAGTEKGVWYEHINGVDTLNILSGTVYTLGYRPRALAGQHIQAGRYYFKCSQALPSWLGLTLNPLEIRGDTSGCKRRDLRDLWVMDRYTERVIAKLRITLVIVEDWV